MKLVGQQFGNYRLTHHIARGGFADVYLGVHRYLNTYAAIKIIDTQMPQNDVQDFFKEAQMIATLRHPHIVRLLEFGVEKNIPFLVMEYAKQGTLRQRHPKGTVLPIIAILSYVEQIASALQCAHDHRLIHRDVKPGNMLMERNGEVLLSDFGITVIAYSTSSQVRLEPSGTPLYMAPEQWEGQPRPASDQYALAVVVYEWLSGKSPFQGNVHALS
jgi:serine/threonine protein kinase